MIGKLVFSEMPLFLRFKLESVTVKWMLHIGLSEYKYRLCRFIYHRDNHFTSRIVTANGKVWCNNEMLDG